MAFPYDSALPKDVVSINPHYNGSDPQQLANALKTNLQGYTPVGPHPFTIKVYDALAPPPSYPLATATQEGTAPSSQCPREIALCLSYFSTYNRPRFRGRLYLPVSWFTSVVNVRPSGAVITGALDFAPSVLTKALPSQTNWVVWSAVEKKSQGGVSDVWVDDEWDTIRSRGLSPTTRQTAKV
jgi:hypothetical protein